MGKVGKLILVLVGITFMCIAPYIFGKETWEEASIALSSGLCCSSLVYLFMKK